MSEKRVNIILNKIKSNLKKGWLFGLTIFIFLILLLNPYAEQIAFIPDWLNLEQINPKEYFGLIIGAIASIFGILMAVILLTVEFFKERINNNKHINPLENDLIRNCIYNSVNLIGLSFIAYIFIENFRTSKSLTIGYFLGIIFIAYIYSVFPVLKRIVGKSSQIKNNIELVKTLVFEDFKKVSKYRYSEKHKDSKLKELKKEIDIYILDNNILSYENISERILNKSLGLISEGSDREVCDIVLGALTWMWRENCKTAIRANDSQYFDYVWNSIEKIYLHAAANKIELLFLYEIESFIYFDLKGLYKVFQNTLSLSTGLDVIEQSFNANLQYNCPQQEEIWDLIYRYENKRIDSSTIASSQWDHINRVMDFVFDIQDVAIELRDKSLYKECNMRINSFCTHIAFNFNNLGKYQKGDLIWKALSTNYYKSSIALEVNLYNSTLDCYKIHDFLIKRLIKEEVLDERDLRIILRDLGNNLFKELKQSRLHTDYNFGTFADFCRIGIYSIKNYKNRDVDKNVVNYFYRYLKRLKKFIEKEGVENYTFEYKNIKRALNHYIKVAVDIDRFDDTKKPVIKWKSLHNSFQPIPDNKDFIKIKWKIKKSSSNE